MSPSALLLTSAAILLAASCLGFVIANLLLRNSDAADALSVSLPIGMGIWTWQLFLVSWAGVTLTIGVAAVLYAVLLAAGLSIYFIDRRRTSLGSLSDRSSFWRRGLMPAPRTIAITALLAIPTVLAIGVSIGRAYSYWDGAAIWSIKGYGIALEGSVYAGARWGAHGLSYPLNIPLAISLFQLTSGDLLPGSKLIFPLMYASMLLGIYRYTKHRGLGLPESALILVLIATTPKVFLHATLGYANLALATYLVLGALWGMEAIISGDRRTYVLSGLLLGLAAWTRPEGIVYCIVIVPALLFTQKISGQRRPHFLAWILPLIVIYGIWSVFSWQHLQSSSIGSAMGSLLPSIRSGEYRLWELYLIPRLFLNRMFDIRIWGLFFPITGMVAAVGLLSLRRLRAEPDLLASLLLVLTMSIVPIGLFYVQSFSHPNDIFQILNRSFDRAFLPAAIMIAVLSLLMLHHGLSKSGEAANAPA